MVNLSYASFDELRVYCTCYVYETGPWFALNIKRDKTKRNKDLKKALYHLWKMDLCQISSLVKYRRNNLKINKWISKHKLKLFRFDQHMPSKRIHYIYEVS